MSHVFISYVRENQEQVNKLCAELTKHGVKVWLDKKDIKPGSHWKDAVREAIQQGDFFIACFSKAYSSRRRTYMNQELALAIQVLSEYPTDRAWFIPVLLEECDVPARSIGGLETLLDIQWVTLYADWNYGINRILDVIHPIPVKIQKLIEALGSDSKSVRDAAIKEATAEVLDAHLLDKNTIGILREALNDVDQEVAMSAAIVLEKVEDHSGKLKLIEMLNNEISHIDVVIRMRAIDALGNIAMSDISVVTALINILDNRNDLPSHVASILEKIGNSEALKAIERYKRVRQDREGKDADY